MSPELIGTQIHITGIVQGVGFRPFVYNLACQYSLKGWVKNTSAGVDIQVDGPVDVVQAFITDLQTKTPPLARIDTFEARACQPDGFSGFAIIHSESIPGAFQPISPDVSICQDCLDELFTPTDRRYHYPFINCTNCGPRFTIIGDIPYDRPNTTMADFQLCPDCAEEYANPLDRRFHAQPVACPVCGPQVWLESGRSEDSKSFPKAEAALIKTQELLREGRIVAVKGLGGFHLACNAESPEAVDELRRRKLRVDKPFAVMLADIKTVSFHCELNTQERQLLESSARPIVILKRKLNSTISPAVSPGQETIGVMLPYTPLHYLLFAPLDGQEPPSALVMTSGNLSEEPIVTENEAARQHLAGLADAFLMNDRPIYTRCDDSVMRVNQAESQVYPLRRSRGYAPNPVRLPWQASAILATGAELKNTFCLTHGDYAFLSQHIGDLENYETLQSFEENISHFERLFRVRPDLLAYDLHPDYLATRYALDRAGRENLPAIGVQHHHAHIASLMAEHNLSPDQKIIGVAFDGTGFGSDGAIWGGEFLLAGYSSFQRLAHLAYLPLPGGDAATHKPARIALAYLWQYGLEWDTTLPSTVFLDKAEQDVLINQLQRKINTPLTSSMGRLFDAVSALTGVRQQVNYEAQAAIEFESLVDEREHTAYDFELLKVKENPDASAGDKWIVEPKAVIESVYNDAYTQVNPGLIAARFHNTVANMVLSVCQVLHDQTGVSMVGLSGGVWQNMTLLYKTFDLLNDAGFKVLVHHQVPPNDGGLSLGQAAVASAVYLSNPAIADR